jgi:phage terminase large subunit-like protein
MSDRDFCDVAWRYACDVLDGTTPACHWIKQAAKRFIADLERFEFDCDTAQRYCEFIEHLHHIEGEWEPPTLVLEPFQAFFVVQLFGFRKEGKRRFSHALFAIGRKNAKSTLLAAILIAVQCLENEAGAQVIAAATTGKQARIVWEVAKRMIDKDVDLREAFGLATWAHSITRLETGSSFKPINSKASTQDGLNPSAVCLDELHAHKSADLLNVLKSAAGARRNPLWLYATTEGYESAGPWPEERRFAEALLDGLVTADHYLAILYTLDPEDEEWDESAWPKANPLMHSNPILLDAIRKEAIEAKAKPGGVAEFRIKRLNRRAVASDAWVDLEAWNACDGPVDLDELQGYDCWGALDLASTADTTAWRLLWHVDGMWYTWGRCWVPEAAVELRTARGAGIYQQWLESGHMTATQGNVADYGIIEASVAADCERFGPKAVAYDPWNASDLVNRLVGSHELPMIKFIQGTKSYHPALQALHRAYMGRQLAHGGDPVLRWHLANVVARTDANLNQAPDKKRSVERIDSAVALMMCFGLAVADVGDEESVYESRGLLAI